MFIFKPYACDQRPGFKTRLSLSLTGGDGVVPQEHQWGDQGRQLRQPVHLVAPQSRVHGFRLSPSVCCILTARSPPKESLRGSGS